MLMQLQEVFPYVVSHEGMQLLLYLQSYKVVRIVFTVEIRKDVDYGVSSKIRALFGTLRKIEI